MIGVGEKFPPFKLNGIDKDNNFVSVEVLENYEPLKNDWTVVYFYPKISHLSVNRDCWNGYVSRPCDSYWYKWR